MGEETMRILQMLEAGKISAEEAERLIAAVSGQERRHGFFVPKQPKIPKEVMMRIETIPEQVGKAVSAAVGSMGESSVRNTYPGIKKLDMKAANGTLELVRSDGDLAIDGSTLFSNIRQEGDRLDIRTVTADVVLEMPDNIEANFKLANADLSAKEVIGKIRINAASADTEIDDCSGRWEINSITGDIEAKSVSGKFDIDTRHGDTELEISGPGEYTIRSVEGDIGIRIPENIPVTGSAKTLNGEIDLSGEFERKSETTNTVIFERSGEGESIKLSLVTDNGDIEIK